jgi:uncharacterized damage-inducible protein DinB
MTSPPQRLEVTMILIRTALAFVIALALPQAAAAQEPLSRALGQQWDGAKGNIVASADQMPEAEYGFKPVDSVRSFGAILAHIAGANYVFCAPALGTKAPYAEDHFEKAAKSKAEIVKALRESVAFCDKAFTALTDRTAAEMVPAAFGSGQTSRASALLGNIGHLQEHYGNLVTYFRIKGLVPPSSRSQ